MKDESELQAFEDWLYEKFARSTVEETIRKIKHVSRECGSLDRESILEYLRSRRKEGATNQLVNEYIKAVNRFMAFSGQEKIMYLHENKRSFQVKGYDPQQVRRILESVRDDTAEGRRNYAMLYLAFTTGLRRDEICNLKVDDIHGDYISIIGKGSKKRDVYLPSDTREVLAAYLQTRNMKESQYVFTTRKGRITNAYMGSLAHDISRKAGIQFSWHRARHTYAKSMIRSGIDLETLRLLLGHERLDTTQIYALKDQEEALNEVRRKKPSFF
ncbi:MAG: tyrosine-type recombinase/integrase, partial [Candidatus Micrarchaeaceae archaeon]